MTLREIPPTLMVSIAGTVLGCLLFAGFLAYHYAHQTTATKVAFQASLTLSPTLLLAQSAVLYDPSDGRILFEKKADAVRPLASLTKLMSAEVVLNNEEQFLNTPITMATSDLATAGDAGDWGFHAGDVVTLGNLVKFGLVASSNDAMAAAATSLGPNYINDMNRTAGALGLMSTYFLNSTGLDLNDDTSGAYGSATDVARLAAAFLKTYPQYFELTEYPTIAIDDSGKVLVADATARPIQNIPGLIGAKTGYTDLAGGNLVAAFDIDIGHPLIAVVLGSTEEGRFSDIRTIINAARTQYL